MKTKKNFRVIVYPDNPRKWVGQTEEDVCKEIRSEINRHIDNVDRIEIIADNVCSFCGYDYNDGYPPNPICCDKAIKEWKEQEK